MIKDFLDLIFPRLCSACCHPLRTQENLLCLTCLATLPKTSFLGDENNPVNEIFLGRIKIEIATSFYSFEKEGRVQRMLYELKYKGKKELGRLMGELFAFDVLNSSFFDQIDAIVPVPLHRNKLRARGYNQSEWIAMGISNISRIPLENDYLHRKIDSRSQTKQGKYDRWESVSKAFEIKGDKLDNKRLLLVDDVITTGSTIEACSELLIQRGCKVWVVTMAYA